MEEYNLSNTFKVWKHIVKNNWSINGYKCIYTFNNGVQFWQLYNNWNKLGTILDKPLFLMKENVQPIWEDENNINGGCWSFKIFNSQAEELWEELSTLFVTNNLLNDTNIDDEILGLSISIKKNNYIVIKIWNRNNKNNSIININKNILNKWGTDIIYISHNS